MSKIISLMAVIWLAGSVFSPLHAADEATISSDEMEILNNGARTVFIGHVVLEKPPYRLTADRMTRLQSTGIVEAEGRVTGRWVNPAGEKAVVQGDHARYDPVSQVADIWMRPDRKVTITLNGTRGSGKFQGDRAVLYVQARHVQLLQNVTGHVIPAAP